MNRIVILLFCLLVTPSLHAQQVIDASGAVIRSDTTQPNIYLCFTGHDFYEGFDHVLGVLKKQKIRASFFLTGDFVRAHRDLVKSIAEAGHFVGAHSDKHLLYCDWDDRDSLLHTPAEIKADILGNLQVLDSLEIRPRYFMPPYEWGNREVVEIAEELNQTTINFSPGTRSNADYTTPEMPNYRSSAAILAGINDYERHNGMNGFHLLIHPGTNPKRKDKLYLHLEEIIGNLRERGYRFLQF